MGKSKQKVGNAGQYNACLGVTHAEGGVVWRRQRSCFGPSASNPWGKMAGLLEVRQDGPFREAVYAAEDAWHDGPGGLPA